MPEFKFLLTDQALYDTSISLVVSKSMSDYFGIVFLFSFLNIVIGLHQSIDYYLDYYVSRDKDQYRKTLESC